MYSTFTAARAVREVRAAPARQVTGGRKAAGVVMERTAPASKEAPVPELMQRMAAGAV
jgi:hypothetical protein